MHCADTQLIMCFFLPTIIGSAFLFASHESVAKLNPRGKISFFPHALRSIFTFKHIRIFWELGISMLIHSTHWTVVWGVISLHDLHIFSLKWKCYKHILYCMFLTGILPCRVVSYPLASSALTSSSSLPSNNLPQQNTQLLDKFRKHFEPWVCGYAPYGEPCKEERKISPGRVYNIMLTQTGDVFW